MRCLLCRYCMRLYNKQGFCVGKRLVPWYKSVSFQKTLYSSRRRNPGAALPSAHHAPAASRDPPRLSEPNSSVGGVRFSTDATPGRRDREGGSSLTRPAAGSGPGLNASGGGGGGGGSASDAGMGPGLRGLTEPEGRAGRAGGERKDGGASEGRLVGPRRFMARCLFVACGMRNCSFVPYALVPRAKPLGNQNLCLAFGCLYIYIMLLDRPPESARGGQVGWLRTDKEGPGLRQRPHYNIQLSSCLFTPLHD